MELDLYVGEFLVLMFLRSIFWNMRYVERSSSVSSRMCLCDGTMPMEVKLK